MEVLWPIYDRSGNRAGDVFQLCGRHQLVQIPFRLETDIRKIGSRADAAQLAVIIRHKQRPVLGLQHHVPCMMNCRMAGDDGRLVDIDILHHRSGIRQKKRIFLVKSFQNELGLFIERALAACLCRFFAAVQKICIRDGCTDAVGIRMPMPGHIDCRIHRTP